MGVGGGRREEEQYPYRIELENACGVREKGESEPLKSHFYTHVLKPINRLSDVFL